MPPGVRTSPRRATPASADGTYTAFGSSRPYRLLEYDRDGVDRPIPTSTRGESRARESDEAARPRARACHPDRHTKNHVPLAFGQCPVDHHRRTEGPRFEPNAPGLPQVHPRAE